MVKAKLYKPAINSNIIARSRLNDWFEKCEDITLILVVAPAGFGKSICVSQWLDYKNEPYGWISLDEGDNQLQLFLSLFIASIKKAYPNLDLSLEKLLQNIESPGFDIITDTLLNDLDKIDEKFTLVLDDYHLISNTSIHKLINQVIRFARTNLRLIITTRTLPPFQLGKIKMHSKIAEMTINELQFSPEEFDLLIQNKNILGLSERKKQSVLDYTEGWVVGIQIVIDDLKKYGELVKGNQGLKNAKKNIFDIFLEDVFTQQQPIVQKQLVISAQLGTFSEELINYVSAACFRSEGNNINKQDFIRFLQRRNLFLVETGANKGLFRFHHLFQEFLIKQTAYVLDKNTEVCLLAAAATWYSDKGLIERALGFALKSSNFNKALEIFAKHRLSLLNTEQFSRLRQCLELFPAEFIEKNPILVLSRALLADSKANYTDMAVDLSTAQVLLKTEQKNEALKGEVYALTACMKYLTGEVREALDYSSLALDVLPETPGYIIDFAMAYRAMSTFSEYSIVDSIKLIDDALTNLTSHNVYGETRLLSIKCIIYSIDANYTELERVALRYLALGKKNNLIMSWVMASYFLGTIYYKKNQLQKAKTYLEAVIESKFFGRPYWNLFCSKVYLDTLAALGDFDACTSHFIEIDLWVAERKDPGLFEFVKAVKTEFAITSGYIEKANKMVVDYNLDNFPLVPFYAYFPQLTEHKVRLLDDDSNHWDTAFDELHKLANHARDKRFNSLLAETMVLKAVYYQRVGNIKEAKECVLESIDAVNGGTNIRTYADLGPLLSTTILSFTEHDIANKPLSEIVDFFKNNDFSENSIKFQKSSLEVSISQREKEIVRLISYGLRNSEIANELHISEDTVKKHLYNAYKKLGVRNRISAIKMARELNIIQL